jgi:hypothetical protein
MRISDEFIRARLAEAAGAGVPVVAWGYGYTGPSRYFIWVFTAAVLALGVVIGTYSVEDWRFTAGAVVVACLVYAWLRGKVTFLLVGVSPRHFIAIERRGRSLRPPSLQGLSAIQHPRVIEKELSEILHFNLGDGTIHDIRFENMWGLKENRSAAFRLRDAILENV